MQPRLEFDDAGVVPMSARSAGQETARARPAVRSSARRRAAGSGSVRRRVIDRCPVVRTGSPSLRRSMGARQVALRQGVADRSAVNCGRTRRPRSSAEFPRCHVLLASLSRGAEPPDELLSQQRRTPPLIAPGPDRSRRPRTVSSRTASRQLRDLIPRPAPFAVASRSTATNRCARQGRTNQAPSSPCPAPHLRPSNQRRGRAPQRASDPQRRSPPTPFIRRMRTSSQDSGPREGTASLRAHLRDIHLGPGILRCVLTSSPPLPAPIPAGSASPPAFSACSPAKRQGVGGHVW